MLFVYGLRYIFSFNAFSVCSFTLKLENFPNLTCLRFLYRFLRRLWLKFLHIIILKIIRCWSIHYNNMGFKLIKLSRWNTTNSDVISSFSYFKLHLIVISTAIYYVVIWGIFLSNSANLALNLFVLWFLIGIIYFM